MSIPISRPSRPRVGLFLAPRFAGLLMAVGLILAACEPPGSPVSSGDAAGTESASVRATAAVVGGVGPSADPSAGPGTDSRSGTFWLPSIAHGASRLGNGLPASPATDWNPSGGQGTPSAWHPRPADPDAAVSETPAEPLTCDGVVERSDDALVLDGQPVQAFGVNAHFLMDDEFPEARVDSLLAELSARGVNAVRTWAFHYHDLDRIDRTLAAAGRHGIRLVLVLEDNVFEGEDWFFGEEDEEAYRPHLHETVSRFAYRPEVLMWEVINEPNCGDGGFDDDCLKTIRDWVTMASEMIQAIDPCHPVSTGMIGAGNFENDRENYRRIHRKGSVDVVSVHRRTDQSAERELDVADDANRPIVYGEIYDVAHDEGCLPLTGNQSPEARSERVKADLRQAWDDGVDAYLLWDYNIGVVEATDGDLRHYCSRFGYEADDPVWDKLVDEIPPVPWRE